MTSTTNNNTSNNPLLLSLDDSDGSSCAHLLLSNNNNNNNNRTNTNTNRDLNDLIVGSLSYFADRLWLDAQLTTSSSESMFKSSEESFEKAIITGSTTSSEDSNRNHHHHPETNAKASSKHFDPMMMSSSSSPDFFKGVLLTLEVYISNQLASSNSTSNNNATITLAFQTIDTMMETVIKHCCGDNTRRTNFFENNNNNNNSSLDKMKEQEELCRSLVEMIDRCISNTMTMVVAGAGSSSSAETTTTDANEGSMSSTSLLSLDASSSNSKILAASSSSSSTTTMTMAIIKQEERKLRDKLTSLTLALARACRSISLLTEFMIENDLTEKFLSASSSSSSTNDGGSVLAHHHHHRQLYSNSFFEASSSSSPAVAAGTDVFLSTLVSQQKLMHNNANKKFVSAYFSPLSSSSSSSSSSSDNLRTLHLASVDVEACSLNIASSLFGDKTALNWFSAQSWANSNNISGKTTSTTSSKTDSTTMSTLSIELPTEFKEFSEKNNLQFKFDGKTFTATTTLPSSSSTSTGQQTLSFDVETKKLSRNSINKNTQLIIDKKENEARIVTSNTTTDDKATSSPSTITTTTLKRRVQNNNNHNRSILFNNNLYVEINQAHRFIKASSSSSSHHHDDNVFIENLLSDDSSSKNSLKLFADLVSTPQSKSFVMEFWVYPIKQQLSLKEEANVFSATSTSTSSTKNNNSSTNNTNDEITTTSSSNDQNHQNNKESIIRASSCSIVYSCGNMFQLEIVPGPNSSTVWRFGKRKNNATHDNSSNNSSTSTRTLPNGIVDTSNNNTMNEEINNNNNANSSSSSSAKNSSNNKRSEIKYPSGFMDEASWNIVSVEFPSSSSLTTASVWNTWQHVCVIFDDGSNTIDDDSSANINNNNNNDDNDDSTTKDHNNTPSASALQQRCTLIVSNSSSDQKTKLNSVVFNTNNSLGTTSSYSSSSRQQQQLSFMKKLLLNNNNSTSTDENSSWKIGHPMFTGYLAEFRFWSSSNNNTATTNVIQQKTINDIKTKMNISLANVVKKRDPLLSIYIPHFASDDDERIVNTSSSSYILQDYSRNLNHGYLSSASSSKFPSSSSSLIVVDSSNNNDNVVMKKLPISSSSSQQSQYHQTLPDFAPVIHCQQSCNSNCFTEISTGGFVVVLKMRPSSSPLFGSSSYSSNKNTNKDFVLLQYNKEGILQREIPLQFESNNKTKKSDSSSSSSSSVSVLSVSSSSSSKSESNNTNNNEATRILITFTDNQISNKAKSYNNNNKTVSSSIAPSDLYFVEVLLSMMEEGEEEKVDDNIPQQQQQPQQLTDDQNQTTTKTWLSALSNAQPFNEDFSSLIELLEFSSSSTSTTSLLFPYAVPIILNHLNTIIVASHHRQEGASSFFDSPLLLSSSQIYSVIENLHLNQLDRVLTFMMSNNNNNDDDDDQIGNNNNSTNTISFLNSTTASNNNNNIQNPVANQLIEEHESLRLLALVIKIQERLSLLSIFPEVVTTSSSTSSSLITTKLAELTRHHMQLFIETYLSPLQVPALCTRLFSLSIKKPIVVNNGSHQYDEKQQQQEKTMQPSEIFLSLLLQYFRDNSTSIIKKILLYGTNENKSALRVAFQYLFGECCRELMLLERKGTSTTTTTASTSSKAKITSAPNLRPIFTLAHETVISMVKTALTISLVAAPSSSSTLSAPSSTETLELVLMMISNILRTTAQTLVSHNKYLTTMNATTSSSNNNNNNNHQASSSSPSALPLWAQRLEAVHFFLLRRFENDDDEKNKKLSNSTTATATFFFSFGALVRISLITLHRLSQFLGPAHGQQSSEAVGKFREAIKEYTEGLNINKISAMIDCLDSIPYNHRNNSNANNDEKSSSSSSSPSEKLAALSSMRSRLKQTVNTLRDIDMEICLVLATLTCDLVWNSPFSPYMTPAEKMIGSSSSATNKNIVVTTSSSTGGSIHSPRSSSTTLINNSPLGTTSTVMVGSTLGFGAATNNNSTTNSSLSSPLFSDPFSTINTYTPTSSVSIIRKVETLLQLPSGNNNHNNVTATNTRIASTATNNMNFGLLFSRGFQKSGNERELLLRSFMMGTGNLFRTVWEQYYEKQYPSPASYKQPLASSLSHQEQQQQAPPTDLDNNKNNNTQQRSSSSSSSLPFSLSLIERALFAALANLLLPIEVLKKPPALLNINNNNLGFGMGMMMNANNNNNNNQSQQQQQSPKDKKNAQLIRSLLSAVNSLRSWLLFMRQSSLSDLPEIYTRASLLCKVESADVLLKLFETSEEDNNNTSQNNIDSNNNNEAAAAPVVGDVVTRTSLQAYAKAGNKLSLPKFNQNNNNQQQQSLNPEDQSKQFRQMYASWKAARRTRHLLSTTDTTTSTRSPQNNSNTDNNNTSQQQIQQQQYTSFFDNIKRVAISFIQLDEYKFLGTNQHVILSKEVELALHRRSKGAQARLTALGGIRNLLLSGGVFSIANSGLLATTVKIAKCFSGRHVLEPVVGGSADSVMRARGALSQLLVDVCLEIDRASSTASSSSLHTNSNNTNSITIINHLVQVLISLISCHWTKADFWQWPVPALPKILGKLSFMQSFIDYHKQQQSFSSSSTTNSSCNTSHSHSSITTTTNGLSPLAESAVIGDCSSSLLVSPRDFRTVRWTAGRGTCFGSVAWRSNEEEDIISKIIEQNTIRVHNNNTDDHASSSSPSSSPSSSTFTMRSRMCFSDVLYFEVSVTEIQSGGSICVGLAAPHYNLSRPLGWDSGSIALHSEDGAIYSESSQGRQFIAPLVASMMSGNGGGGGNACIIGCGIVWQTNEVFFTLNGALVGCRVSAPAFNHPHNPSNNDAAAANNNNNDQQQRHHMQYLSSPNGLLDGSCYPAISLDVQAVCKVNFGSEPFAFSLLANRETLLLSLPSSSSDKKTSLAKSLSPRPLHEQSWDAYRHWIVHLVASLKSGVTPILSYNNKNNNDSQQQSATTATTTTDYSAILRLAELVTTTMNQLNEEFSNVIYKNYRDMIKIMMNSSPSSSSSSSSLRPSKLKKMMKNLVNSQIFNMNHHPQQNNNNSNFAVSPKKLFDFLLSRFTETSEMLCLLVQSCQHFLTFFNSSQDEEAALNAAQSNYARQQHLNMKASLKSVFNSIQKIAEDQLFGLSSKKKTSSTESKSNNNDHTSNNNKEPTDRNHHRDTILTCCWTMWFHLSFVHHGDDSSKTEQENLLPLLLIDIQQYTQLCTVKPSAQYAYRAKQLQILHHHSTMTTTTASQKDNHPHHHSSSDSSSTSSASDDDDDDTNNNNRLSPNDQEEAIVNQIEATIFGEASTSSSSSSNTTRRTNNNNNAGAAAASSSSSSPQQNINNNNDGPFFDTSSPASLLMNFIPATLEPSALTAATAIYDVLYASSSSSSSNNKNNNNNPNHSWSNIIIQTFDKTLLNAAKKQKTSSLTSSEVECQETNKALIIMELSSIAFILSGQARKIPQKGSIVILHGSILLNGNNSNNNSSSSSSSSSTTGDNTTNVNQQQLHAKSQKGMYVVKICIDNEMGIAEIFSSNPSRFGKHSLCVCPSRLEVWRDKFGFSTLRTIPFDNIHHDNSKTSSASLSTTMMMKNLLSVTETMINSCFLSPDHLMNGGESSSVNNNNNNNNTTTLQVQSLEDKLCLTWLMQTVSKLLVRKKTNNRSSSRDQEKEEEEEEARQDVVSSAVRLLMNNNNTAPSNNSANSTNNNNNKTRIPILASPQQPNCYSRLRLDMDEEDLCNNILLPFFGVSEMENRPRGKWNIEVEVASSSSSQKTNAKSSSTSSANNNNHRNRFSISAAVTSPSSSSSMMMNSTANLRPFVPAYLGSMRVTNNNSANNNTSSSGNNNNNNTSNSGTNNNNLRRRRLAQDLAQRVSMPIEICMIALEETNYDRTRALRLLMIQQQHEDQEEEGEQQQQEENTTTTPNGNNRNNDDDDDDDQQQQETNDNNSNDDDDENVLREAEAEVLRLRQDLERLDQNSRNQIQRLRRRNSSATTTNNNQNTRSGVQISSSIDDFMNRLDGGSNNPTNTNTNTNISSSVGGLLDNHHIPSQSNGNHPNTDHLLRRMWIRQQQQQQQQNRNNSTSAPSSSSLVILEEQQRRIDQHHQEEENEIIRQNHQNRNSSSSSPSGIRVITNLSPSSLRVGGIGINDEEVVSGHGLVVTGRSLPTSPTNTNNNTNNHINNTTGPSSHDARRRGREDSPTTSSTTGVGVTTENEQQQQHNERRNQTTTTTTSLVQSSTSSNPRFLMNPQQQREQEIMDFYLNNPDAADQQEQRRRHFNNNSNYDDTNYDNNNDDDGDDDFDEHHHSNQHADEEDEEFYADEEDEEYYDVEEEEAEEEELDDENINHNSNNDNNADHHEIVEDEDDDDDDQFVQQARNDTQEELALQQQQPAEGEEDEDEDHEDEDGEDDEPTNHHDIISSNGEDEDFSPSHRHSHHLDDGNGNEDQEDDEDEDENDDGDISSPTILHAIIGDSSEQQRSSREANNSSVATTTNDEADDNNTTNNASPRRRTRRTSSSVIVHDMMNDENNPTSTTNMAPPAMASASSSSARAKPPTSSRSTTTTRRNINNNSTTSLSARNSNNSKSSSNNNNNNNFQGVIFDSGVLIAVVPLSQPEWSIEMIIKPIRESPLFLNPTQQQQQKRKSSSSSSSLPRQQQILASCSFGASCDQLVLWLEDGKLFWGFPKNNNSQNYHHRNSSYTTINDTSSKDNDDNNNVISLPLIISGSSSENNSETNDINDENLKFITQSPPNTFLRVVASWSRNTLILTVGERNKKTAMVSSSSSNSTTTTTATTQQQQQLATRKAVCVHSDSFLSPSSSKSKNNNKKKSSLRRNNNNDDDDSDTDVDNDEDDEDKSDEDFFAGLLRDANKAYEEEQSNHISDKLAPSLMMSPSHTPSSTAMLNTSLRAVWSFGGSPDGSSCLASTIVKRIVLFNCCSDDSVMNKCDFDDQKVHNDADEAPTSTTHHHRHHHDAHSHFDSFDKLTNFIPAVRCVFESNTNNNNNNHSSSLLMNRQRSTFNVKNETESGVVLDIVGSIGWVPKSLKFGSNNNNNNNSSNTNNKSNTPSPLTSPRGSATMTNHHSKQPLNDNDNNNNNNKTTSSNSVDQQQQQQQQQQKQANLLQHIKTSVDFHLQEPPYPELDFSSPLDPSELFTIDETNDIVRQQDDVYNNSHDDGDQQQERSSSFLSTAMNFYENNCSGSLASSPTTSLPSQQDIGSIYRQLKQCTPEELCQITNYTLTVALWRQSAQLIISAFTQQVNEVDKMFSSSESQQKDFFSTLLERIEDYFASPILLAATIRRIIEALAEIRPEQAQSLCASILKLNALVLKQLSSHNNNNNNNSTDKKTTNSNSNDENQQSSSTPAALTTVMKFMRSLISELLSISTAPLEGITFESPHKANSPLTANSEPPREVFVPHARSYDIFFDRNINTGRVGVTFYSDHTLNKICARASGYPIRLRTYRFCFDIRWDDSVLLSGHHHHYGYRITVCTGVRKRLIAMKLAKELMIENIKMNNINSQYQSILPFEPICASLSSDDNDNNNPSSSSSSNYRSSINVTASNNNRMNNSSKTLHQQYSITNLSVLALLVKLAVRNVSYLRREACSFLSEALQCWCSSEKTTTSNTDDDDKQEQQYHHQQVISRHLLSAIQDSGSLTDLRKMLERQHRRESSKRMYSRFVTSLFKIFMDMKECEAHWSYTMSSLLLSSSKQTPGSNNNNIATTSTINNDHKKNNTTTTTYNRQRAIATEIYRERTLAGTERVFLEKARTVFSAASSSSTAAASHLDGGNARIDSHAVDRTWTAWCESPGVVPVVLIGKNCRLTRGRWYYEIKLLSSNADVFVGMVRSPSENNNNNQEQQQQQQQTQIHNHNTNALFSDIFGFENGSYRLGNRCLSISSIAKSLAATINQQNASSSSSSSGHNHNITASPKAKDVLGVCIDIEEGTLSCTLNGVLYPRSIPLRHLQVEDNNNKTNNASSSSCYYPLDPAIGISGYKEGVSVNFGSAPFEHEPPLVKKQIISSTTSSGGSGDTSFSSSILIPASAKKALANPTTAANNNNNNNNIINNNNSNSSSSSGSSSSCLFYFFPLDPSNLTMGSTLPLNIVRAFIDSSENLLRQFSSSRTTTSSTKIDLPRFFSRDFNIFDHYSTNNSEKKNTIIRQGPAQTSLLICNKNNLVVENNKRKQSSSQQQQLQTTIIRPGVVPEIVNESNNFSTVIADCEVSGGKWYYECTLKSQGLMQIGWCIPSKFILTSSSSKEEEAEEEKKDHATNIQKIINPNLGVGDDNFSVGIDLFRRIRWFGGIKENLATTAASSSASSGVRRWATGDILGTSIDFEHEQNVIFYLNGSEICEVSLKSIGFDIDSLKKTMIASGGGVSPAFSVRPGSHLIINFGSRPHRFKPEGYTALSVPDGLLERIETHYKSFGEEDTMMMNNTNNSSSSSSSSSLLSRSLVDRIDQIESCSRSLSHQKLHDALSEAASLKKGTLTVSTISNPLSHALQLFDRLVNSCLPLIDHDEQHNNNTNNKKKNSKNLLYRVILAARPLMLPSTRQAIANWWIKETSTRGEDLRLALNRTVALKRQKEGNAFSSSSSSTTTATASLLQQQSSQDQSASSSSISSQKLEAIQQHEDPHAFKTLFGQTFSLLRNTVHPRAFRTDQHRAWTVVFVGEGAEDVGGPFREHVSSMCTELMSSYSVCPLFIPSPNNTLNVGTRRDAVVVNPFFLQHHDQSDQEDHHQNDFAKLSPQIRRDLFRFFGMLLGVALREKEPLSLSMTTHFWKALCREDYYIDDYYNSNDGDDESSFLESIMIDSMLTNLESFDVTSAQSLRKILEVRSIGDQETFDSQFGYDSLPFRTILLSHGDTFDIVQGKVVDPPKDDDDEEDEEDNNNNHTKNRFVTFENAKDFVRLAARARLLESKAAIDACREGLTSIIPPTALYLLNASELEVRICGRPDYSASELKSMTIFESIQNDDTRVEFLWKFIDDISPSQRKLFLRFVSGRERLPVKLKVLPMTSSTIPNPGTAPNSAKNNNEDPDELLPRAATCFFALELPQYSCYSVFKAKMLFAVTHCWEIDTDFRARDLDGDANNPQLTIGGVVPNHAHTTMMHMPTPTAMPTTTAQQVNNEVVNTPPSSSTASPTQQNIGANFGNSNNNTNDGVSSTYSQRSSPTNVL